MKVLIVEDNEELVSLLIKGLERSGFTADSVDNADDAARALATTHYTAVVLDLGLPGEDGLSLLRDLRSRGESTPVLVLTARNGISDRVTGLHEGADDYMAKPFAMDELVARLQALSRRPDNLLGRRLAFGNVTLDTEIHQVTVDGVARPFPAREVVVLEILLRPFSAGDEDRLKTVGHDDHSKGALEALAHFDESAVCRHPHEVLWIKVFPPARLEDRNPQIAVF